MAKQKKEFEKVVIWKEGSLWGRIYFFMVLFVGFALIQYLWIPLQDITGKIIYSFVGLILIFHALRKEKIAKFGKRKVTYKEI